jgi:antitoxin MazE
MKAKIIKIGNSKGIRLPKAVVEQCDFKDEVSLLVKENKLIITSHKKPRQGWAEAYKKILKEQKVLTDDLKDFRDFTTEWEENEWEW